jgi:urease accessory protein
MKRIPTGFLLLPALVFLSPALAYAHLGNDAGLHHVSAFLAGFIHPFTGLDHMLAMIAVGIWSVQAFRHTSSSKAQAKVWIVPLAFAGLMLAGGVFGIAGVRTPLVEPMIAASLLVLGLFVALRVKLPLPAGAAMVGTFAIFHGLAHGSELPAGHALALLSGMVIATMLLHVTGMLLGRFVMERNVWLPRIAGAAAAAFGIGLLAVSF